MNLLRTTIALCLAVSVHAAQEAHAQWKEKDNLQIGEITVADGLVLDAPMRSAKTMLPVKFGLRFPVRGTDGDYYKIVTPSGDTGFVAKSSMRITNSPVSESLAGAVSPATVTGSSVEDRIRRLEAKVEDLQRQLEQLRRLQVRQLSQFDDSEESDDGETSIE